MKGKIFKIVSVFIFAFCCPKKAISQHISTLGMSNYGVVHSYYINPSLNAYSKYKWQINLGGGWLNFNNNYITHKLPFSAYKLPNNVPKAYQDENGNLKWNRAWLTEKMNGSNKHLALTTDIYGPSASVQIKTWRVGFISSANFNARVYRLPENLAHAIFKEFDSTKGAFSEFKTFEQGGDNTIKKFNITANSRISAGLNLSKAIALNFNRQLLLGATIKRHWGMPGVYLNNQGLTLKTINPDSVVFMPMAIQMVSFGNTVGKGMGYDIGATYIFNKKPQKRNIYYHKNITNYYAKIGFAILDIGKITYQNAQFTTLTTNREIGINSNTFYINNNNYLATADSFLNAFGTIQKYTANYTVGLPTRLTISSDFQLRKNIFLATILTQSLRKRSSQHARYQSTLMISPRWEYRYFEFSLPALLAYDYRSFRLGASFRFGPLYIGSNSIYSFINTKAIKDADIFVGIAFGNNPNFNLKTIFKRKKAAAAKGKLGCFKSF